MVRGKSLIAAHHSYEKRNLLMNMQPTKKELQKFRPKPFYFITTTDKNELSFETVYASLERLKEEGFGGIVLFNKPPHGFDAELYLSDAWFEMVRNVAKASEELELDLWINDGFDFPPGSVGGRINKEKYPHLAQKRLKLVQDEVVVEEVDWGFPAFEEPDSAALFHEYVYEAYLANVGEYFGNPICGFFSDADNRRVSYRVFQEASPQKDYFPWSSGFAESFQEQYGYDIKPYLKGILKKEDSSQGRDYWEHAGKIYQSWFASNYQWCREHGLEYTFHTSDTSPFTWEQAPRSSIYTEGRALDMESNSDYPGTDQELLEINGGKHMRKEEYWMPHVSWGGDNSNVRNPEYRKVYGDLRAKQAGSAAFLHNKKGAMCEMFAATNWGASPTELREIASWQIMQGITFIVPHAYHHRLLGETKYFAPPIYSPHSTLNYSAKQLNDTLAMCCYYASLGSLQAPIAVLDITDDIWEGREESDAYFVVCEQLNRMPYGYVLADAKSIVNKKEAFSVIINAGAPLIGEREKVLSELNIPIIEPKELHKLSDFIDCKVSYEGEGMPHFMRRQLASGEELVIIANIEDDKAIRGNLTVGNTTYVVTLQTGEMAFFTERDRITTQTQLEVCSEEIQLLENASVVWGSENLLPLEYWKNENGNPICKTADERYFSFAYNVMDAEVKNLKLMLPKGIAGKITEICMDGKILISPIKTRVFDEAYLSYDLADFVCVGQHEIVMKTQEVLSDAERIFLQGEFGVDVSCGGEYAQMYATQYSLDKYIPEYAEVTLRKRPMELSLKESWTEQGHPFYSGTATYCLPVELPVDFGQSVLSIPEVHDGCIVTKDGIEIGNQALQPYIFDLGDMGGTHTLHLTVYNSMANAMECYRERSGITVGVLIGKKLVNQ